MTRYSVAIFLLANPLVFLGCAGVETPPTRGPMPEEPRVQAPASQDEQADISAPIRTEEPEETAVPAPSLDSEASPPAKMHEVGAENVGDRGEIASKVSVAGDHPAMDERTNEMAAAPNESTPGTVGSESSQPNATTLDDSPRARHAGQTTTDANEPGEVETVESSPMADTPGTTYHAAEPNGIGPADSPETRDANDLAEETNVPAALAGIYERYGEILAEHVRENGLVDYAGLRRRRLDLKALLMELDELDPNEYQALPRDEKLALWLNAYNLKMLEIIARNYPIESSWWLRLTWPPSDIRHIKGIRTDYKFIVMDEEFTLDGVERRFFRQTFGDPRVYLAITHAGRSGPSLRRRPYRGPRLDGQLDGQVRAFLARVRGLQIDRDEKVVRLSALFKPTWYGKDFVDRYGTEKKFKDRDPATRAVLHFLTNYLSREDVYFLETENYTLEYMNFDWRLNDTARGY